MSPDALMLRLGYVIRRHRDRLKYRQRSFADTVGVRCTYYGNVERSKQNPTLWDLHRIALDLRMDLSNLIAEAEALDIGGAVSEPLNPPPCSRTQRKRSRSSSTSFNAARDVYARSRVSGAHLPSTPGGGLMRDLLGNYRVGATLTDDDILRAAAGILEAQLMRSGEAITDPSTCARYLKAKLAGYPYEVFGCLFLDNRHRVLAFEELFRGSIDDCAIHPREVVRRCLYHNASAVIFSHNHPSGVSEPSAADRAITQRLKEALDYIGVRVLDHLIVSAGTSTSLARRGLM